MTGITDPRRCDDCCRVCRIAVQSAELYSFVSSFVTRSGRNQHANGCPTGCRILAGQSGCPIWRKPPNLAVANCTLSTQFCDCSSDATSSGSSVQSWARWTGDWDAALVGLNIKLSTTLAPDPSGNDDGDGDDGAIRGASEGVGSDVP